MQLTGRSLSQHHDLCIHALVYLLPVFSSFLILFLSNFPFCCLAPSYSPPHIFQIITERCSHIPSRPASHFLFNAPSMPNAIIITTPPIPCFSIPLTPPHRLPQSACSSHGFLDYHHHSIPVYFLKPPAFPLHTCTSAHLAMAFIYFLPLCLIFF